MTMTMHTTIQDLISDQKARVGDSVFAIFFKDLIKGELRFVETVITIGEYKDRVLSSIVTRYHVQADELYQVGEVYKTKEEAERALIIQEAPF